MTIGDFSNTKDGEIIGGDYAGAEFGIVAISKHDFVCAIKDKKKVIKLNDLEVEYFAPLKTKGLSKGTTNLIEATVHGVLSAVIPGGGIIGNTAAAAAGVASRSAATHAAGGIRDHKDVLVVFRDGRNALIRCADAYVKIIKKHCSQQKLAKGQIDSILDRRKENILEPPLLRGNNKELSLKCGSCHERVSSSDRYCPHCGAKILDKTNESLEKQDAHKNYTDGYKTHKKKRIPRIALMIGAVLILILILVYIFSPPEQVISYRLNRIIDTCSHNESSNKCKALQDRYKIKFRYCYAYFDIPEIDQPIPVYAVAEREDFKRLSLTGILSLTDFSIGSEISPYYACVDKYSDLGKNIGNISEDEVDGLQASYWLKNRPKVSFDSGLCRVSYSGFDSVLWNNIPNFKDTIYEARTEIESRNNYCFMKDNPRLAELFGSTDNKLRRYSENDIVREYFWGFDMWNSNYANWNYDQTVWCVYGEGSSNEKKFWGKCLTEVGEEGYPLSGFVSFMKERRSSSYYEGRLLSR